MRLDLVAIPPAFLGLDQIARVREVADDPVGATLSDGEGRRNVANADVGIASDAEQRPSVVREEVPGSHNG